MVLTRDSLASEERYRSSRSLRGSRPGYALELVRYLALGVAALLARPVLGTLLVCALATFLAVRALLATLFLFATRMDVPIPAYDYRLPKVLSAVFFVGRVLAIGLLSLAIIQLRHVDVSTLTTTAKPALLGSAMLFLLVLLGRQYDTSTISAELVRVRRSTLLHTQSVKDATHRVEDALLGIAPGRLALPTGSGLFAVLEDTKRKCTALIERAARPGALPQAQEELAQIESAVISINGALASPFKLGMWALSASHELNLGLLQVGRRLQRSADELNEHLRRARVALSTVQQSDTVT